MLGLHSKDRKPTRDKSNIGNPKVNRGCPPPIANSTSADFDENSLGPSVHYIPLRVYHIGGFNAMGKRDMKRTVRHVDPIYICGYCLIPSFLKCDSSEITNEIRKYFNQCLYIYIYKWCGTGQITHILQDGVISIVMIIWVSQLVTGMVDALADVFSHAHSGHSFGTCNTGGPRILEFTIANGLRIENTWFKKRNTHLIT